jgi:hypothetical protein
MSVTSTAACSEFGRPVSYELIEGNAKWPFFSMPYCITLLFQRILYVGVNQACLKFGELRGCKYL